MGWNRTIFVHLRPEAFKDRCLAEWHLDSAIDGAHAGKLQGCLEGSRLRVQRWHVGFKQRQEFLVLRYRFYQSVKVEYFRAPVLAVAQALDTLERRRCNRSRSRYRGGKNGFDGLLAESDRFGGNRGFKPLGLFLFALLLLRFALQSLSKFFLLALEFLEPLSQDGEM